MFNVDKIQHKTLSQHTTDADSFSQAGSSHRLLGSAAIFTSRGIAKGSWVMKSDNQNITVTYPPSLQIKGHLWTLIHLDRCKGALKPHAKTPSSHTIYNTQSLYNNIINTSNIITFQTIAAALRSISKPPSP